MRRYRRIGFAVLAVVVCIALSGCGSAKKEKKDIELCIGEFQRCCQELDYTQMAECWKPDGLVNGTGKIINLLEFVGGKELTEQIQKTVQDAVMYVFDNEEVLQELELDIKAIHISEKEADGVLDQIAEKITQEKEIYYEAKVKCKAITHLKNNARSMDIVLTLQKRPDREAWGEKWYITSIKPE